MQQNRFLWLAGLLGAMALSWLAAGSEPYPAAFGPAPGFWGMMVSGDRGGVGSGGGFGGTAGFAGGAGKGGIVQRLASAVNPVAPWV